ncbi:MAG: response regulator transcription factor [Alphaproteobacteria bacterium]|nr:response regulator transcription factor [Alphaproteobacteria bacterium]MCB9698020.1 response regulator transcription factor [Alphaproteobacteria bacterium]
MDRVLFVDDDVRLSSMVSRYLAQHGFEVHERPDATSGMAAARNGRWDAILLDVNLPDGDGFDLCRTLRAGSDVPILLLTARGEDTDRIVGLELGADDYLPKPFNPRELVARLRAVLRRSRPTSAPGDKVLRFGRLQVDAGARQARLDGEALALTAHQFDLLLALAERPGRVLSREQLMRIVRDEELEAFDRSIDVHISRIRALVEDDPRHPKRILTSRGAGYLFAEKQS